MVIWGICPWTENLQMYKQLLYYFSCSKWDYDDQLTYYFLSYQLLEVHNDAVMVSKSGFPVDYVIYLTTIKPRGVRNWVGVKWHSHLDISERMPIYFGWVWLRGCCSILWNFLHICLGMRWWPNTLFSDLENFISIFHSLFHPPSN